MLERIIELLLALAVAAAAAVGIGTATTTPRGVGPDPDSIEAKAVWAKQQAGEQQAVGAELTADDAVTTNAAAGIETALEALERVMGSAPDAASKGLQQAWDSVSNAGPPEDATGANAAPVEVPAGPPAEAPAGPPDGVPPLDVPAGPPAEKPAGAPDGVPPGDTNRP